jgi:hypothetical protein
MLPCRPLSLDRYSCDKASWRYQVWALMQAFDGSHVTLHRMAQCLECGSASPAAMSGDSLLDAVSCKSVIVRAAIDVDRLAGDEAAILAN